MSKGDESCYMTFPFAAAVGVVGIVVVAIPVAANIRWDTQLHGARSHVANRPGVRPMHQPLNLLCTL